MTTLSLLTHCLLILLLLLTHPQPPSPLTDLLTSPSAALTVARYLLAINLLLQFPLTAYYLSVITTDTYHSTKHLSSI